MALPAASIVRTVSDVPTLVNVTPVAVQFVPEVVAVTHVVPPSGLTWIVSPAANVPVKVPPTVCNAVAVMKSLLLVPWPPRPKRAGRRHRRSGW